MAGEFLDMLFDEEFIEATSIVKHGKDVPTKGHIFIENEADELFWIELFGPDIMKNYEISMCSGPNAVEDCKRGKQRFYKNFKYANRLAIFAIDADFAHLTPNRHHLNKEISDNAFIVHTMVYSKESIRYCIDNLNCAIKRYRYNTLHSYSFDEYLITYSNLMLQLVKKRKSYMF